MARANDVKDFQQCSAIQKEIMEFFNRKAQVQAELKDHLKKESRNKSYLEKVATSKRSNGSSSSKIADIRRLFSFKSNDDNKSKGIKSGTATVVDLEEEMTNKSNVENQSNASGTATAIEPEQEMTDQVDENKSCFPGGEKAKENQSDNEEKNNSSDQVEDVSRSELEEVNENAAAVNSSRKVDVSKVSDDESFLLQDTPALSQ